MTENLRDQVARLRDLAPQLNRVTDAAANLVYRVEKLLGEECSIGISASENVRTLDIDSHSQRSWDLVYGRHDGKFRLYVNESVCHISEEIPNVESSTPWASCSRDMKLASFQVIPRLLAKISKRVEQAIKETEGTLHTIDDLLDAFASKGDQR